ncbi:MAG: autoinducer binding domain-containing protein [Rhodobacter sp.]|nr:autoinducer binding domain-containing protein [Rhodobacter sp.]MBK8438374.1 autoinducer binding domain-containing protein [Rhodobacter sp.]
MQKKQLTELYEELHNLAPEGYAVGLHIRFATPLVYHNCYPAGWVEHYNSHSYYLRDPLVFWGIGTTGTRRWSEIPLPDPFGLLKKAVAYGMRYGAVSSYGPITSRSMAGVTRSEREFTDEEMARLADITARLHIAAKPPSELSKPQIEALQCIANGDRHTAAAAKLGISESAFKARLASARVRLEARTTSEALRKAREYRLL